jgi:hypothetical protein
MTKMIGGAGLNCRLKVRGKAHKVTCQRSGPYCNVCEFAPGVERQGNLASMIKGPIAAAHVQRKNLKNKLRIDGVDDTEFVRERRH